jgi:hypothetical protein
VYSDNLNDKPLNIDRSSIDEHIERIQKHIETNMILYNEEWKEIKEIKEKILSHKKDKEKTLNKKQKNVNQEDFMNRLLLHVSQEEADIIFSSIDKKEYNGEYFLDENEILNSIKSKKESFPSIKLYKLELVESLLCYPPRNKYHFTYKFPDGSLLETHIKDAEIPIKIPCPI